MGNQMNHSAVTVTDPVLRMFDEDISGVLAEISAWLGIGGISLEMEPELARHRVSVTCRYAFTNDFYTTLHKGNAAYDGVPAIKRSHVGDHVKSAADKLFKSVVSSEGLRRDIFAGGLWSERRVVCDEILATSHEECNSCDSGAVTCGGCDGDGTRVCNYCRISGHPRGYITCWGCHGTGGSHDSGTGKWSNCSICWGRKRVLCTTCGGSEKVRCGGCGGHGTVNCGSCAGNGFFTRAHGYRISASSRAIIKSETLPEMHVNYMGVWLKNGLPGRVGQKTGTVMPCAEIDMAEAGYAGWKDGVFEAVMDFDCHVTTGDVKAAYRANPIGDIIYGRWDAPAVGFSPFLNPVIDDVVKLVVEKDGMKPSEYLGAFSHIPGLVAGMRGSGSSAELKTAFIEESSKILRNSVSAELVDIAIDGYLESVGAMENDVSGRVGRDVALGMCALWIACWYGGLFEYMVDQGRDQRLMAFAGLALCASWLSATAVRFLTRRRIKAETGAAAKYRMRRTGKFLCLLGGLAFAFSGAFTVTM